MSLVDYVATYYLRNFDKVRLIRETTVVILCDGLVTVDSFWSHITPSQSLNLSLSASLCLSLLLSVSAYLTYSVSVFLSIPDCLSFTVSFTLFLSFFLSSHLFLRTQGPRRECFPYRSLRIFSLLLK